MITVTGATGQLGRLVIDALRARVPVTEITAAVRDPSKAADIAATGVTVVRADYNVPGTLAAAFAGTDRLLIISGNEFDRRAAQYADLTAAAQAAGVSFIAYTSIINNDGNPMYLAADHKIAERLIADSGIPNAFLRNGWYNENYIGTIQGGAANGAIIGAAGAGRISSAARADYAAAAAAVMAEGRTGTFELGGSTSFTLKDLAAMIADVTGKTVVHDDLTATRYAERLKAIGVPDSMAEALADSDRHAADGWLFTESRDLETLIGRKSTPMADTVRSVLAAS